MNARPLHPDGLVDLRNSGLTDESIVRAGLGSVRPESLKKLGTKYRGVLHATEFPYFNVDGTPKGFARLKLFWSPDAGNGDLKRARYYQPKRTPTALYLPPLIEWAAIAADPAHTLTITEGEKKAIAGCQAGISCAAVGGVWNWLKKLEDGERIALPEFDLFAWRGRSVELVPDSDAWGKEKEFDVLAPFYALAMELTERGAVCRFVRLPEASA
jgi:hypothetical protein